MSEHGKPSGFVALLLLASIGLMFAGAMLAPDALPSWLMLGGWGACYWALGSYYAAARRRLDPRVSERGQVAR